MKTKGIILKSLVGPVLCHKAIFQQRLWPQETPLVDLISRGPQMLTRHAEFKKKLVFLHENH